MGVHVVGLSHHTTPLPIRERVTLDGPELHEALHALHGAGAAEVVIFSTCNRTEIYARDDADDAAAGAAHAFLRARGGLSEEDAGRFVYTRSDDAAARHLFRVVSGIDSLVLGEPQIQGQVRSAYESAASQNGRERTAGPILSRLFETALSVGGRVRAETRLGAGAASVPSAAVALARKIFGSLQGRSTVIVGAGEMGELTLQCLLDEGVSGVVVANRTAQRAENLVARLGGEAATFERLPELLRTASIVACATAAPHHVISADMVARAFREGRKEPMLLLDIALPRDVEPGAGSIDGVFLYDVDDLQQVVDSTLAQRRGEIDRADAIIGHGVSEFMTWYRGRSVVPVIQALRGHAEQLRQAELERALRSAHLDPQTAAAVDVLTKQLLNKILHAPTTRLREAAKDGREGEVAEAARYLFGLDEMGGQD
ncbi:MAG TPA: glutamyl-tRNA reductase [Longimicrobiales bacterium]|nr:glutamyl-tRNA reductase [Longimicrobiales bacterium]